MYQTLSDLHESNVPRLSGAETAHSAVTTQHHFSPQESTPFDSRRGGDGVVIAGG